MEHCLPAERHLGVESLFKKVATNTSFFPTFTTYKLKYNLGPYFKSLVSVSSALEAENPQTIPETEGAHPRKHCFIYCVPAKKTDL